MLIYNCTVMVQQLCTRHDHLHVGNLNHKVKWERNGKVWEGGGAGCATVSQSSWALVSHEQKQLKCIR